jgi:hypothetical protein
MAIRPSGSGSHKDFQLLLNRDRLSRDSSLLYLMPGGTSMRSVSGFFAIAALMFVAPARAQAADLPVKAKAVEYVRICSGYGAGFHYIPGTDTCIQFGGYLRVDLSLNGNVYVPNLNTVGGANNRLSNYYFSRTRLDFAIDTRTATEYGLLRTYTNLEDTWNTGQYFGSAPGAFTDTAGSSNNIGGGTLGVYRAFIQFAGFTLGRSGSAFDAPWQSYPAGGPDTLPGGSNHVTGVNQLTYTAQFGSGVSGSLSVQDPTLQNTTNLWNTSYATAAGLVAGTYGTNSFGGTRAPDIVGALAVDQAWGLFKLSAAAHDNHVSYFGTTEPTGHPADKWGWAVQAALSIKNIPTGQNDVLNLQAAYTDGATRYNWNGLNVTTYAMYGGSGIAYQSLGIASVADVTYNGTTAAGSTYGLETVKTWGFRGGFTHNWNANWASAIYGAYGQVKYGAAGSAVICANMRALLALTGNCDPNFNVAVLGGSVIWTPVKGFAFSVGVNATRLDQKYSGVITAPPVLFFSKPGAIYELRDQTAVSMLLRAQRNY